MKMEHMIGLFTVALGFILVLGFYQVVDVLGDILDLIESLR